MIPNLYSTRFRPRRYRPDGQGYWSGHLPLAADLVDALKPGVLVELGTYYGESYFGFCQAIQERGVSCRAYAVDTWKGDTSTGRYGQSIFEAVSAHNAAHYSAFSSLLPLSFDEASVLFSDSSIDLLHLDGCHTYSAIKHDFETWLSKVAPGGVVLIHDIAVRQEDFGVWQFWEEISQRFPSFAFTHSCGLGVLVNGEVGSIENPFLKDLVGGVCDPEAVRDYYLLCAERLPLSPRDAAEERYKCQVYWPEGIKYAEGRSEVADVPAGQWINLSFDVPAPEGRLRLDPVNVASTIEFEEITVECPSTGMDLWRLDPARPDEILVGGTSVRIPGEARLILLSYGDDPQIHLPLVTPPDQAGSVRVQCRMRVDLTFDSLRNAFEKSSKAASDLKDLRTALASANLERAGLLASLERANSSLDRLERQFDEQARAHAGTVRALEAKIVALEAAGEKEKALRSSLSWRITKPMRIAAEILVKAHRSLLRVFYESSSFAWTGKPLAKAIYAWGLPGSKILLPPNPLFAADFYAASNPDVRKDRSAWAHYLGFGADEGRDPHPMFQTSFYLARNPDVAASGLNPLMHYLAHGAAENRSPHPASPGAVARPEHAAAAWSALG